MANPPLTHHEILTLVAPLTRQGLQVDLAASSREARQLVFKPLALPAAPLPGASGSSGADAAAEPVVLQQVWRLDCASDGWFKLSRTLSHPSGLQATLQGAGVDQGALLAQMARVPAAAQWRAGPGWLLALGHELLSAPHQAGRAAPVVQAVDGAAQASTPHASDGAARPGPPLSLVRGTVQLNGLRLDLGLLAVRGAAADLALKPTSAGERLALPEDLLAVLGWDWTRLAPAEQGWTSRLRLRGGALRKSRRAERELVRAAQHLARVLAEPPAMYHQRHGLARVGAMLRRAIPSFTAVFLIAGALALPRFTDAKLSGLWMALHYLPIALLAVGFSLQELPRFEIPRWPRRPRQAQWRQAGQGGGMPAAQESGTPEASASVAGGAGD